MTKIIKFPQDGTTQTNDKLIKPVNNKINTIVAQAVRFIWVLTVLVWPMLKWFLSIEVFFQMVRMFYYWNTQEVYAGWNFFLHFTVLTAITYFVSIYKPKGI